MTAVEPLAGYRLKLQFSDGTSGVADLTSRIRGPFARLTDPRAFAEARVEHGTVCWPGDLDLAAECLYALAHGLEVPRTHEQVHANEDIVRARRAR